MSDDTPQPDPAVPASPFGQPPEDGTSSRRPILIGCGIGCSVLVLLVLILMVALLTQGTDLFGWSLQMSQKTLLRDPPDDWTEADSERLRRAFTVAAEAVAQQRAELEALESLRPKLMDALLKATRRQLTRQDLLSLIDALEAVASSTLPAARELVRWGRRSWAV